MALGYYQIEVLMSWSLRIHYMHLQRASYQFLRSCCLTRSKPQICTCFTCMLSLHPNLAFVPLFPYNLVIEETKLMEPLIYLWIQQFGLREGIGERKSYNLVVGVCVHNNDCKVAQNLELNDSKPFVMWNYSTGAQLFYYAVT